MTETNYFEECPKNSSKTLMTQILEINPLVRILRGNTKKYLINVWENSRMRNVEIFQEIPDGNPFGFVQ